MYNVVKEMHKEQLICITWVRRSRASSTRVLLEMWWCGQPEGEAAAPTR